LKKPATLSRASKTALPASMAYLCAERPGLPEVLVRNDKMASTTTFGLGKDVAA